MSSGAFFTDIFHIQQEVGDSLTREIVFDTMEVKNAGGTMILTDCGPITYTPTISDSWQTVTGNTMTIDTTLAIPSTTFDVQASLANHPTAQSYTETGFTILIIDPCLSASITFDPQPTDMQPLVGGGSFP